MLSICLIVANTNIEGNDHHDCEIYKRGACSPAGVYRQTERRQTIHQLPLISGLKCSYVLFDRYMQHLGGLRKHVLFYAESMSRCRFKSLLNYLLVHTLIAFVCNSSFLQCLPMPSIFNHDYYIANCIYIHCATSLHLALSRAKSNSKCRCSAVLSAVSFSPLKVQQMTCTGGHQIKLNYRIRVISRTSKC